MTFWSQWFRSPQAAGRAGAPETKASRGAALLALTSAGQPVWTPRDYAALAREGFQGNAIVYRVVRMIAEAAASVPWLYFEGRRERPDHPLGHLLRAPNPLEGGADLLEQLYGFLLVSGNAYAEAVRVDGIVQEIYALRPDRMTLVPGAKGWPVAYEYSVEGRKIRYAVSDDEKPILHVRLFHPLNDHYGFSPMEAAAAAIDVHNAAMGWNKALLDNGARPSGALVYNGPPGVSLTADQFERLKSELEDSFQGSTNAGRPLLLEGGLDWKALSVTPRDMDFIEAKAAAARDIALAFGVPPVLIGLPGDSTYSNYSEANRAFWRQCVLPLAQRMAANIARWLGPDFGTVPDITLDLDAIAALSEEREALWRRVGAADFLSRDEKRAATGYGDGREEG
ncbi:phage portal protein [Rhizobiales bacterium TNE-4]|nr:phage portal protein [Rhizobiales bacterium TNE-4]MBV1826565.1 phage portal protein [Rhizobiales bacterium TNE-4]